MTQKNDYFIIDGAESVATPLCLDDAREYGWGWDFYIDVFRLIEEMGNVRGLSICLSYGTPIRIPKTGKPTVLVFLNDERYTYQDYFKDVVCIFRGNGTDPLYLDGIPTSSTSVASLIHFIYKKSTQMLTVVKHSSWRRPFGFWTTKQKSFHTPLGVFWRFDPIVTPMAERSKDFAFLGSMEHVAAERKLFHRFLSSPKTLSRENMLRAFRAVAPTRKGVTLLSEHFEESVQRRDHYLETMRDAKISIVPRGTSYETYRFFESMKAGCVVICERLPKRWCYEGHPGISIKSWSNLPALIEELLDDPVALEERASASRAFWTNTLSERKVAERVERVILEHLAVGSELASHGSTMATTLH